MGKEGTFRPAALARAGCEDEVSILNRSGRESGGSRA
jgi:hypothetical protein